ncbi:hypothetical protein ACLOJK_016632 [Asimina triloba]
MTQYDATAMQQSARIQTVLCIPLMDGVLELGTTERVQEDLGVVQHAKSFFMDRQNQQQLPKPALSEHSTSNPASSDRPRFHSLPLPALFSIADPPTKQVETNHEEDDDDDDDDDEVDSDSEGETGKEILMNAGMNNLHLHGQIPHVMSTTQIADEPSELMQLEMSEDIQIGSPDDCSDNVDPELHMVDASHIGAQADQLHHTDSYRGESARAWPLIQDDFNILPTSGSPQLQELSQEDAHYSQTVSTILQLNADRWAESSCNRYFGNSSESAFSNWSCRSDLHHRIPLEGTSQWCLKYVLFTVPFLHSKYRDENSPKSQDGDIGSRMRKSTSQDELSANHVLAERRRREKLNERFIILRSLVPFVTKMDKASILGDTIEYVKQLRKRIQDLESRNQQTESDQSSKGMEKPNNSKDQSVLNSSSLTKANTSQNSSGDRTRIPMMEKRKMRIVEGSGSAKIKGTDATFSNAIQVSIIESDALLELQCPCRDGLLLDIMQTLSGLRVEVTAVQSSSTNGNFVAEIRAKSVESHGMWRKPQKRPKLGETYSPDRPGLNATVIFDSQQHKIDHMVKDRINGKKASIVEVPVPALAHSGSFAAGTEAVPKAVD